jgi:hypothetical protein
MLADYPLDGVDMTECAGTVSGAEGCRSRIMKVMVGDRG